jgi:hypothetical protein
MYRIKIVPDTRNGLQEGYRLLALFAKKNHAIGGDRQTCFPTGKYDGPNIDNTWIFTFADILKKIFSFKIVQFNVEFTKNNHPQLISATELHTSEIFIGIVTAAILHKNYPEGIIFTRSKNHYLKTLHIKFAENLHNVKPKKWDTKDIIKKAAYVSDNTIIALSSNSHLYKLDLDKETIEKLNMTSYPFGPISIIDIAKNNALADPWILLIGAAGQQLQLYLLNFASFQLYPILYKITHTRMLPEKIWFDKNYILTEQALTNSNAKENEQDPQTHSLTSKKKLHYVLYELRTNALT